jgi:hypothetical protein
LALVWPFIHRRTRSGSSCPVANWVPSGLNATVVTAPPNRSIRHSDIIPAVVEAPAMSRSRIGLQHIRWISVIMPRNETDPSAPLSEGMRHDRGAVATGLARFGDSSAARRVPSRPNQAVRQGVSTFNGSARIERRFGSNESTRSRHRPTPPRRIRHSDEMHCATGSCGLRIDRCAARPAVR